MPSTFTKAFLAATGKDQPYDYQTRLACGQTTNLSLGILCQSQLIEIPTGLGKTAAVVLAWVWNRLLQPDKEARKQWPRRLVYCLPMRTLVEQTRDEVRKWLLRLARQYTKPHDGSALRWLALHSPIILMGGEDTEKWDIYPEKEAILIGTQDMLLSRALNRGYGMNRYRWPMHFAWLNNDCLWIFDEVQLMGNGFGSGIQLDGFRSCLWPVAKPCLTWWMSATTSQEAFETVDRVELGVKPPSRFMLTESERRSEELKPRLTAEKKIEMLQAAPTSSEILSVHQKGQLTLVILNTVQSALDCYEHIILFLDTPQKVKKAKRAEAGTKPEILLLHSRYRRADRADKIGKLYAFIALGNKNCGIAPNHPGLILIATQVIEAGVDISAAILLSEIAPWASTIQRLGRLNRDNRHPNARAKFWKPKSQKKDENAKDSPNAGRLGPYEKSRLDESERLLAGVVAHQKEGSSYRDALDLVLKTKPSQEALKIEIPALVRADDVYGLFSTEPDLAGGFTDISTFIRTTDLSSDVTVFWRRFEKAPPKEMPAPSRDEYVAISAFALGAFLKDTKENAFLWNEENSTWDPIRPGGVVPGMTLLLPLSAGGYSKGKGWTGNTADKPNEVLQTLDPNNSLIKDSESQAGFWQSLDDHTASVIYWAIDIAKNLEFGEDWIISLRSAGHWHDVGKRHAKWQECLPPNNPQTIWGKFEGKFKKIPFFRHEALSLLAAWSHQGQGVPISEPTKLTLYLIASHHGKIRTVLRSSGIGNNLFGWKPMDSNLILEDGRAIKIELAVRNFFGAGELDWENRTFTPTRPSWTSIIQELLGPAWPGDQVTEIAVPPDQPRLLGPFKLAFLESVFRAADARASMNSTLTQVTS